MNKAKRLGLSVSKTGLYAFLMTYMLWYHKTAMTITACKENMPEKTSLKNDEIETKKQLNRDFMTGKSEMITQKTVAISQYDPNYTPFSAKMKCVLAQTAMRFGRKRSVIWVILQGKCL